MLATPSPPYPPPWSQRKRLRKHPPLRVRLTEGANGGSCSVLYGVQPAGRSTGLTDDRPLARELRSPGRGANGGSCSFLHEVIAVQERQTTDDRLVGSAQQAGVRTEGVEPSRELPRQNLNLVRLPIPPRSLWDAPERYFPRAGPSRTARGSRGPGPASPAWSRRQAVPTDCRTNTRRRRYSVAHTHGWSRR